MTEPEKRCPTCGRKVNLITTISPVPTRLPEPGDFLVCMYCGELLRLTEFQSLVLAQQAEIPVQRLMEYRQIRDKIRAKRAPYN